MRYFLKLRYCIFLLSFFAKAQATPYSSLVNPFIGTGGHGHTYPGPSKPYGMIQVGPDTRLEGWDGCSGYHYSDTVVYGFSRAGAPSLMTAVIIGVCIGFLPHNWHPARIFMGDSGSMLLGLVLASSAITLTGQIDPNAISEAKLGPTLLPLFLPFAVLAIPLSDLVLAVIRRLAKGKSPFSPDKEHLHHRLMSAGKTQQRTAVIMYLATATIAFPVTIAAFEPIWVAALSAIVLLTITISVYRFKFEKVAKVNG